jgi:hypothetical protein
MENYNGSVGNKKTSPLLWFETGDEKEGMVTVWTVGKDFTIKILGQTEKKALPKTAIYDCPYH